MIKLIIFDFDGVIVLGTNDGYFACYHRALEEVGVKLDPQEERRRILERWSQPSRNELEGLLKEHPQLLNSAVNAYEKCYYSSIFTQNIRLVEKAKTHLEKLSEKYILAIASGMRRETMDELIQKFAINHFKHIITNEDVTNEKDMKPSPYMINTILERSHVTPEETIFVGDAKSDVTMARNAGVTPVVVLTGHLTKEEAKELGVKYIISDVTDLDSVLSQL